MMVPKYKFGEWLAEAVGSGSRRGEEEAADLDEAYESQIVEAAFRHMVRRRFADSSPVEIAVQVGGIRQRYGQRQLLRPIDIEMLIRAGVGESVPLGDIDPQMALAAKVLVIEQVAYNLGLTDSEIDGVIARAEQVALGLRRVLHLVSRLPPSGAEWAGP